MKPGPRVVRVTTGHCPTLGNVVRVTEFADETCCIERTPHKTTQISRYSGEEISETITFAVITEPAKLHQHLISNLEKKPAIWPD